MARDPPIQNNEPRNPVKNAAAVVLSSNPIKADNNWVDMVRADDVVVAAVVAAAATVVTGMVATHWMHWA